jgi:hypothetical protein
MCVHAKRREDELPEQPTGEETHDAFERLLAELLPLDEALTHEAERELSNLSPRSRRRLLSQIAMRIGLPENGERYEQFIQVAQRLYSFRPTTPVDGASDLEEGIDAIGGMAVSIYLADEGIHSEVRAVVDWWLGSVKAFVVAVSEPVVRSWFQRILAITTKRVTGTPAGREAILTGLHVADSHLVQTQDAYVTSTLLQNIGPVLQALHPTKDAVIRAGALLIVKVDWVVQVHQLTAAQQAILDHQPKLAASPREILAKLEAQDPVIYEVAIQPAAQPDSGGETTATAPN